jgi:hypothetical protein
MMIPASAGESEEPMKTGRTLQELAIEIQRQKTAKRDFRIDTRNLHMDAIEGMQVLDIMKQGTMIGTMQVQELAHRQIGTHLGIPAKYYDTMMAEYPELLATNVNGWFNKKPTTRLVRTLDNNARAFLSDRYRLIDNDIVSEAVLPVLGEIKDARVESCEITDKRLYIKVVNPRLEREIVPGDIVQSGVIITNSEVGASAVSVQPLVFRLVCSNGMVVNDAATRRNHVGRINEADENYELFRSETLIADDRAFLMKLQDTVRAVVDDIRFDKVVQKMKEAKGAKINAPSIPDFVELTANEFNLGKAESDGVLEHLIRGGDLSLYGLANAVTRQSQDIKSYDRATELEVIGYEVLNMDHRLWHQLNSAVA